MGILLPELAAGDGDEGGPDGEGLPLLPEDLGDHEGDGDGLLPLSLLGDGEPEASECAGLDQEELPAGEPDGDDEEPEDVLLPAAVLLPELAPSTCACQYSHLWKESRHVFFDPCRPHQATAGPAANCTDNRAPDCKFAGISESGSCHEHCREWLAQGQNPTKLAAWFRCLVICRPWRLGSCP